MKHAQKHQDEMLLYVSITKVTKQQQRRLTAEIMLEEIRRRPGTGGGEEGVSSSGGAVAQDREGYALAAGLALGLVTLGRGQNAPGLTDIQMADRLR